MVSNRSERDTNAYYTLQTGYRTYDSLGSYRTLRRRGHLRLILFMVFVVLMVILSNYLGLPNIHG